MANDRSLSAWITTNSLTRYCAAFLGMAGAVLASRTLQPLFGDCAPYVAAFPAIAFAAWYCGLGPSVITSVFAAVGVKYWFIPPVHTLAISTLRQALSAVVILAVASLIVVMGEVRRRENAALRGARGELEELVMQRTVELNVANQDLRELTARLMQSQDDERRRFARELHDSVGQTIAALTMNLTTVVADIERLAQTGKNASDSLALVEEMNKEVRTVSYLLHPPLLDECGLASALRWYVDGFAERSKIHVDLQIPEDFGRFPQELETAVFRTVQECLTNIHRHSGSSVAAIRLARSESEICLSVVDKGAGMPAERLDVVAAALTPGVGLRGMRERLRQLGGTLDIDSNSNGTTVEARLPVANSSTVAA